MNNNELPKILQVSKRKFTRMVTNKARDYTLFGVDADFYLEPLAVFQADDDEEAKTKAAKWMVDSDVIFRLYRVHSFGAFFLGCWHFGVSLNDDAFLDAYFKTFKKNERV